MQLACGHVVCLPTSLCCPSLLLSACVRSVCCTSIKASRTLSLPEENAPRIPCVGTDSLTLSAFFYRTHQYCCCCTCSAVTAYQPAPSSGCSYIFTAVRVGYLRDIHRSYSSTVPAEKEPKARAGTHLAQIGMTSESGVDRSVHALVVTLFALLIRCLVYYRNCAQENENEQAIFSRIEFRGEYR